MTPQLALICRHPLKAHGRESLASVRLFAGQAMPWDRVWAVAHEDAKLDPNGGWSRCINFARAAKAPALMALEARLDEGQGLLTLRHPLRGEIAFHPANPDEHAAVIDWLVPLNPADRSQPVRIVSASQPLTDSAWPSISLLSMGSLRELSAKAGVDLSPHRFRGNLWVEGLQPWQEFDLIGREISIGTVTLLVRERITRCRAIMANPETGKVDVETLSLLQDNWGHQDFGVYVEVLEGGEIALGDKVKI